MRKLCYCLFFVASLLRAGDEKPLRPPAVPLIVHDPYFSVWSMTDRLTDEPTKHWTGVAQAMTALARIDDASYRIMGRAIGSDVPAMNQIRLEVLPTRTIYDFEIPGVRLTFTFLTPTLPSDLNILSRPATYLVWTARSTDRRQHVVSVYFDVTPDLVVNSPNQPVGWSRFKLGSLDVLRMGSVQQPVLEKSGDDLRIDWGHLYTAARRDAGTAQVVADRSVTLGTFLKDGKLPDSDDLTVQLRADRMHTPALAWRLDLGSVGASPVSRHLIIAYDDLFSIEYFHRALRPYWRRNGMDAAGLLHAAEQDYERLSTECAGFDAEFMADLTHAGGEKYARLGALAYRQAVGAHKLVADADNTPLFFPKENSSGGAISTVDVFYPSSPLFLLVNPALMRAAMEPIMWYVSAGRWKWPFAPHDLGFYPLANGQVYGGGEETEEDQMPVEESGNMLILAAALAKAEGNASFAEKYWPQLAKWAEYLKQKGLDPENQLCTDDFTGHLAHNSNLSVKAIVALASFARLCELTGHKTQAADNQRTAQEFAARWQNLADDGDHYRLAFDRPGTWSQKYNLVWDRILRLNLFPPEVARKEIAYYKRVQNTYGLPLDNRHGYTKLDWLLWTATLAESQADFEALVDPAYKFVDESPSRVPLTDWYRTDDARQQDLRARSVVGGLFIKMLADEETWKKWAERGGR
jgi:hypothetical protein